MESGDFMAPITPPPPQYENFSHNAPAHVPPFMRALLTLLLFFVPLFLVFAAQPFECGLHWTWANPHPQGSATMQVIFGADKFVAVGTNGLLMNSADGISWKVIPLDTSAVFLDVIWTGTQFVAGGLWGTILSSPDGENWTEHYLGEDNEVYGLAYDNGVYVAALWAENCIRVSSDLDHWRATGPLGFTDGAVGVAFGAGKFVAVSWWGVALVSTNGEDWSRIDSNQFDSFEFVRWMGGYFIAGGDQGRVLRSYDGINWTLMATLPDTSFWDIAYNGKCYVAVGWDWFLGTSAIWTSKDLTNWTRRYVPSDSWITTVAYAKGRFVAMGWSEILTSDEGIAWFERNAGPANKTFALSGLAYGAGRYVAVGWDAAIYGSENGNLWTITSLGDRRNISGTLAYHCLLYAQGQFVALGVNGICGTSTDGISWTREEYPIDCSAIYQSLAYGNGRWVAVGTGACESTDGRHWSVIADPPDLGDLYCVTFGNGLFVAVGREEKLFTSPDGLHWTRQDLNYDTGMVLYSVIWDGQRFLVSGWHGEIFESVDGVHWNLIYLGPAYFGIFRLFYEGGQYIGLVYYGYDVNIVAVSPDAVHWTYGPTPFYPLNSVNQIYYDGRQYVGVGGSGHVITSCCALVARPFASPSTTEPRAFQFHADSGCSTGNPKYSWDFGDDTAPSTDPSPVHQYASSGTYTALLTVEDDTGPGNRDTRVITVTTPPFIRKITKTTPTKFTIQGENFQEGIQFYINGQEVQGLHRKNDKKLTATIMMVLGKRTPGHLRFVNPDGGETILKWP